MSEYNHSEIENKWQETWEKEGIYKTSDDSTKPKQYVLDMFPYPSGEGLHVGHPRGYIATDVYSRMKQMQGFNILHPMGWDAFGLPAENFAIKNKIHPRVAVEKNVARFKEQLSIIGPNYDWSREINTTDPAFYKWTQWIFLKMYEKGLAYESYEPINWCPGCQTGLANEDIESDGTCERCGSKVEKRPMRQWVLKITEYADRMLADLDKLPKWPEGVKEAQRNWIGRKEGVTIDHTVEGSDIVLTAFSAYPGWLYADTFLVIAPAHPIVRELVKGKEEEKAVLDFVAKQNATSKDFNKEKEGIFTGVYVMDPITQKKMPVWLANFALMDFGTGIIRCSAHDERDYDFAEKYNIEIKEVVERTDPSMPVNAHTNAGILKDSDIFSGKPLDDNLIKEMVDHFVSQGYGKREVTYRIKDWVFSRQRYWGEPIPIIHCSKCGVVPVPEKDLPVLLPEVEHYEPAGTGESPLANIAEWVNVKCPTCGGDAKRETNTMPQWAGSSWYYLRYIDPNNDQALIDPKKEKEWMPVDVYVGGDHATRHLIYARFWHKFLFDIGSVSTEEPFPRLEFLGFILAEDGRKMSKRWGNVINPDDMVARFGADAFRLYIAFIGPFENTVPWSTDGMVGTRRFIEKVWRIADKVKSPGYASILQNTSIEKSLHRTIKKVTEDIEVFKFNTAVSSLMIFVNELEKSEISASDFKKFLQILAPFAPHVTDEIWHEMGESQSIHISEWPKYDEKYLIDDEVTVVVQIAGKVRATMVVSKDATKEDIEASARALPEIASKLEGKVVERVVVVPGRLINFVTKA